MKLFSSIVIFVPVCALQIYGVFIEVPAPLNVTLGSVANFTCEHTAADFIGWRVNGSSADRVDFHCVQQETRFPPSGLPIHILTIEAVPECNNTVVQCVALNIDPPSSDLSPNVSLRIQGPLGSVLNPVVSTKRDSDSETSFDLSWKSPFSLDLTNVDPDIIYCVEMTNITCGANTVLFSNCTVLENELKLVGFSSHQAYEFTISPKSNVKGALSGNPSSIRVEFAEYSATYVIDGNVGIEDSEVVNIQLALTMDRKTSELTTTPTFYSLSLIPTDGVRENQTILETSIEDTTNGYFRLSSHSLPRGRRWDVSVLAFDCSENPVTGTMEISTHDIQNVSVTSPSPGEVRVSYDLIQRATAVGLLTIVYSLEFGKMDIYYFQALTSGNEKQNLSASMHGLPSGHYGVSVFSLEQGGLPFERSASSPKEIYVADTDAMLETGASIQYTIDRTIEGEMCIECVFSDESTEFCVVIVHETLACNTPPPCKQSLTNINASFKFARSGDKASGCIESVDSKFYQVGVIGGQPASGTSLSKDPSCGQSCIDGIVASGIVITVVIAGVILSLTILYCIVATKKGTSVHINDAEAPSESDVTGVRYQSLPNVASLEDHPQSSISVGRVGYQSIPRVATLPDHSQSSIRTTITYLSDDETELPTYDEVAREEANAPGQFSDNMDATAHAVGDDAQKLSRQTDVFSSRTLFSLLQSVADKWKEIGEALFLAEDILDEIYTNNKSNESCLQNMLAFYMMRSDLRHDWEEVSNALRKVGEHSLAENVSRMETLSHDSEGQCLSEVAAVSHGLSSSPSVSFPVAESTAGYEGRAHLAILGHGSLQAEVEDDDAHVASDRNNEVAFDIKHNMPLAAVGGFDEELQYPVPESVTEMDLTKSLYIPLHHHDNKGVDEDSLCESDSSYDSTTFASHNKDELRTVSFAKRPVDESVAEEVPSSRLLQTASTDESREREQQLYSHNDIHIKTASTLHQPNKETRIETQTSVNCSCVSEEAQTTAEELHEAYTGFDSHFESLHSVQQSSGLSEGYHVTFNGSTLITGVLPKHQQSDESESDDYT